MDPNAFLKAVYAAMKPGAVIGVIDHVANKNDDVRAMVEKYHRIDPEVIKADFKRAGFVLVGSSDLLRNKTDDHRLEVDHEDPGHTDRVDLQVQEAALTEAADAKGGAKKLTACALIMRSPRWWPGSLAGMLANGPRRHRARCRAWRRLVRRHLVAERAQDDRHPPGGRAAGGWGREER